MILFTIRFELLLLILKIYKSLVWTEVLFHENHLLFSNFFLLRRLAALFFKRRLFMQEKGWPFAVSFFMTRVFNLLDPVLR